MDETALVTQAEDRFRTLCFANAARIYRTEDRIVSFLLPTHVQRFIRIR